MAVYFITSEFCFLFIKSSDTHIEFPHYEGINKTYLFLHGPHSFYLSKVNIGQKTLQLVIPQASYSVENSPPELIPVSISPHADYPGLEYPPVFEPETYSLADPQSSLTLLRKQGKSNN